MLATEWGCMALACRREVVTHLVLPRRTKVAAERAILQRAPNSSKQDNLLCKLQEALQEYFRTGRAEFDCKVDVSWASPFARAVLAGCCDVACGSTVTYGQLSHRLRRKGAARAVGSALARNPVPIVVPCHRVVAANGLLGGYSAPGGIAVKRRLLRLEYSAGPFR